MRPTLPLLVFLAPFAVLLIGVAMIGLPILRVTTGKWSLSRKLVAGTFLAVMVVTLLLLAGSSLNELQNFLLLIGLCAAAFALALMLLFQLEGKVLDRLSANWQEGRLKPVLKLFAGMLSAVVLVYVSGLMTVPVPRIPSPSPSAVGSLRTTVHDLAVFLIELTEPRYLGEDLAMEIRTPQILAGEGFSWGLGIGIQHSTQGDALWQNAQTLGFRGLMVVYPEHGCGVVVLTNSDDGYPVACDVAQRALGGKALWEFF